jgi:hypothetical protein
MQSVNNSVEGTLFDFGEMFKLTFLSLGEVQAAVIPVLAIVRFSAFICTFDGMADFSYRTVQNCHFRIQNTEKSPGSRFSAGGGLLLMRRRR